MKRIPMFAVIIFTFLFLSSTMSFAKSIVADKDLESIYAQSGSVTITFDDIDVKSKDLRTTSTDGLDWWNPNWVSNPNWDINHNKGDEMYCPPGQTCHGDYILEANWTTNNSDYENNTDFNHSLFTSKGYFGFADGHVTGGRVKRSGSMIIQVFTPQDDPTWFDSHPNVWSKCRLDTRLIDQRIESSLGIEMAIKLGTTPDLSGNQYLGRVYTGAMTSTTSGQLSVYAHNNSVF